MPAARLRFRRKLALPSSPGKPAVDDAGDIQEQPFNVRSSAATCSSPKRRCASSAGQRSANCSFGRQCGTPKG